MRILVLGGIRSGKSRWAESAIAELAGAREPIRYLATGATGATAKSDPDWAARVDAHRRRRPPHWTTAESADVATELTSVAATATLVDDVGCWLTAAMDRRAAWTGGSVSADVDGLVGAVESFTAPLALVSPEAGLAVVPDTASGRLFTDELGQLNQRLAQVCDRVVLVIAGHPVTIKESS